MLHKNVGEISYKHQHKIKVSFKEILGLKGIDHFSLDLVRPNGEMIFFSGTPSHAYEICKQGYGGYDGIILPEYYEKFEFYWWKNATHKAYANKIEAIRRGVLGLNHGFMLVRRWNDFHLVYSFATKTNEMKFQTNVINNINFYLKMGDWAYEEMREIYAEYCGIYEPPRIETFYSFEGGEPPKRYTKNYIARKDNLMLPNETNNIISVNFETRKLMSP